MAVRPRDQGALDALAGTATLTLLALAAFAGLFGGAAAIGLRESFAAISRLLYGFEVESMASAAGALAWWRPFLILGLGGLAVGLFVRFFLPDRRPHGVSDVIERAVFRNSQMDVATGAKTALGSIATLGFGASVGREGPVVHLGAALAGELGSRFDLTAAGRRLLLGAGAAAAVAASFNAPLAGTFFALEVVVARYAFPAFAPVALAAVVGNLLSHLVYGDDAAFVVPADWAIASLWELPAFLLLGLIAAVFALALVRGVFLVEDTLRRARIPSWLCPAVAGVGVAALSLIDSRLLGVGYEATSAALAGDYSLELLVALAALKLLATALCLGGGFVGGVFSPSLVLGALSGGAFGLLLAAVAPEHVSASGAYALAGMGAVAGAVLGAPVSTAVMIVELTGDFSFTLAVLAAVVVASLVTRSLGLRSFFHRQIDRRRRPLDQRPQPEVPAPTDAPPSAPGAQSSSR